MIVGANLRDRLREDTRVAHETLDRVVSDFDLADNHGLVRFLGMQYSALSCIAPLPMSDATRAALTDILERADHDLRAGLHVAVAKTLRASCLAHHHRNRWIKAQRLAKDIAGEPQLGQPVETG